LSFLSESVDYETLQAMTASKKLTKAITDLESRGLLLYEAKRYDLHPVVRGVVAESLQSKDRNRLGKQVVDHFLAKPENTYEQVESLDDLSNALHIFRTLLGMGRFDEAFSFYEEGLSEALYFNLEAHSEVLSLLKPFFPSGWSVLPTFLDEEDARYLAHYAANSLRTVDGESHNQIFGALIERDLIAGHWTQVVLCIANIAVDASLAQEISLLQLATQLARAASDHESLFFSLLQQFSQLGRIGAWSLAEAAWNELDPLGRNWSRAVYRPGNAEYWHARFQFWRSKLQEEQLAEAERLLRLGKHRTLVREGHLLRGAWHLERHEWSLAAASLQEAVTMARAVGQTDTESEIKLALARFHLNQLPDAKEEADHLANLAEPDHSDLAELFLVIGDADRA
jgi:hypothetical protein